MVITKAFNFLTFIAYLLAVQVRTYSNERRNDMLFTNGDGGRCEERCK